MQLQPLCTADLAVKPKGSHGELLPLRCKRWSCETCRQRNRRRVIALGKAGRPNAFLTLTVSSKHYDDAHQAARDLKRAWCALRRRMQRFRPGAQIDFLAVFERHKSGFPHLHILLRAPFISVRRLRTWWEEITVHSWNVNIMGLKTDGQIAYAAKYIGKDIDSFENCKRWWRSHSFNEKESLSDEEKYERRQWQRWEGDVGLVISAMRHLGAIVEREDGERFTWRSPPDREVTIRSAIELCSTYWPSRSARPDLALRSRGPR